jgi:hypothetical protein
VFTIGSSRESDLHVVSDNGESSARCCSTAVSMAWSLPCTCDMHMHGERKTACLQCSRSMHSWSVKGAAYIASRWLGMLTNC